MKSTLFFLLFATCGLLSASAINANSHESPSEEYPTVKTRKVRNWLDTIIAPIVTCIHEADPHAFMMKCFSYAGIPLDDPTLSNLNDDIYTKSRYQTELVFVKCSRKNHIADISFVYDTKEVLMRESLLSKWEPATTFMEKACIKIKETFGKE